MSVVAEFTINADEFLLGRLIAEHPNLSVELERVVPAEKRVMPYVWGHGDDLSTFESTMETNPHVRSFAVLDRLPDSALYKIEWEEPAEQLIHGITETKATILEAYGDDEWTFRIRFEDHSGLAAFHNYCADHGITYRLNRVYALDDRSAARDLHGLTEVQHETLVEAVGRGYFDVPRQVSLAELAAKFDVSEQAVSERIRRATDAVLRHVLFHPSAEEQ
ncbi:MULTISPECIES: helix-turn-helix domain-containing protein [Halorussus]|uniref:helix-turn-helix domain-containing protein n=1 Tax=Halorussus TaxID=1070314 RepID=UPI000E2177C8|nr:MULTISPECIES: helix-turn-helix domain-containing protein [Halorussus]NHN59352.1 bacterio-opsin activator [Halorussus sp. JP-T4]